MHQLGQGVHPFTVDENIQLDKIRLPHVDHIIIKGPVSLGDRFQSIVKIIDYFGQRHFKNHFQPVAGQVLVVFIDTASLQAQLHYGSHVTVRYDNRGADKRLPGLGDEGRIRIECRVVDGYLRAVIHHQAVTHGWGGEDE